MAIRAVQRNPRAFYRSRPDSGSACQGQPGGAVHDHLYTDHNRLDHPDILYDTKDRINAGFALIVRW